MTRIEKDSKKNQVEDLQKEVAKLKKGLKRKQNRKFFSCGSCLIMAIIIIIVGGVFGAYVLAKSGLRDIPYFTDRLYREPQPSYIIDTHNLEDKDNEFLDLLKTQLGQEVIKQKSFTDLRFKYLITEAQLSALFKKELQGRKIIGQTVQFVQVAVLGEELELFLTTDKGFVLTLNILPQLKNGKIDFKTQQVKVGNLKLPNSFGDFTVVYLAEKALNSTLDLFFRFGEIETISMFPTTITLDVFIKDPQDLL
ncbi:hypothetical protein ACFL2U_03830 [Patescibacteria group bacterium]